MNKSRHRVSRTGPTGLRLAASLGVVLSAAIAAAQSFNVDIDIGLGGPGVGAGAPSSSYAAAGMPGYWNQIVEVPWTLRDISGNPTGVGFAWNGGGGQFGYNNPNISGDFKLLMADAVGVGAGGLNITITGLQPGAYRIFVYACKPQGQAWTTMITVPGSTSQNPQAVTGPMPVNQFILGVSHSSHDIELNGGPLRIQAAENQNSYVNGLQIMAVPESSTMLAFALGIGVLAAIRRRRMP